MILAVVVAVNVPHKTSNLSALMFALPSLSCQLRFPNVYDGGGGGGEVGGSLGQFPEDPPHTHTHTSSYQVILATVLKTQREKKGGIL